MRKSKGANQAPGSKSVSVRKQDDTQKISTAELKKSFKKQPAKTLYTLIEVFCCPLS